MTKFANYNYYCPSLLYPYIHMSKCLNVHISICPNVHVRVRVRVHRQGHGRMDIWTWIYGQMDIWTLRHMDIRTCCRDAGYDYKHCFEISYREC